MARTTGLYRQETREKPIKSKGDNITTYLRKVKIKII